MTTSHAPTAPARSVVTCSRSDFPTRRDELFEARLDDRATTGLDLVDLLAVDVDPDNGVPHFGQASRGHGAHVSESNYCDVHRSPSSGSGKSRPSQNGTLAAHVNSERDTKVWFPVRQRLSTLFSRAMSC